MLLVRPDAEHLASYVAALEHGWSADNERGVDAAGEELSRIQADAAAFLTSMTRQSPNQSRWSRPLVVAIRTLVL